MRHYLLTHHWPEKLRMFKRHLREMSLVHVALRKPNDDQSSAPASDRSDSGEVASANEV